MRLLIFIFACLFFVSLQAQTPQVPSSIEIAEVKLKITSDAQSEIQRHVNALRASEKYFRMKLDRVNLYFPIIERVLQEEEVPEDIKYLAIQESSLISDAVSSSNAVGYWQFKDFTAREVGMRVDSKVDERKNIVAASRGAAKYFKRNNFFFKNWIYAVSAYQAGPGGAKKYVNKANFGSDRLTITKKTHWYVLKFIAHVIAFKDEIGLPHSEGLQLAEYTKGAGKSIEQVAREFEVEEDQAKEYNKWLAHGKVPDDKEYTVILPMTGKIPSELAQRGQSGKSSSKRSIGEPQKKTYPDQIIGDIITQKQTLSLKVNGIDATMPSKGDDVKSLAQKAGISPEKLLTYNDLKSTASVIPGQIYYVRKKKNRSTIYHHVAQYDESMWDISQKYGIKLAQLKKINRMADSEELKPGRLMWLRKKRPTNEAVEYHKVHPTKTFVPKEEKSISTRQPIAVETTKKEEEKPETRATTTPTTHRDTPAGDKVLHIVQSGESFYSLSKQYQVEVSEIAQWNNRSTNSTLSIGEEIVVYRSKSDDSLISESKTKPEKEAPKKPPVSPTSAVHVVSSGESLWGISRKYQVSVADIRLWNNLSTSDSIHPGQELTIGQKKKVVEEKAKRSEFTIHVVKGGDSLYQISKKYHTTVKELMALNQLNDTHLSVGDELKVPEK